MSAPILFSLSLGSRGILHEPCSWSFLIFTFLLPSQIPTLQRKICYDLYPSIPSWKFHVLFNFLIKSKWNTIYTQQRNAQWNFPYKRKFWSKISGLWNSGGIWKIRISSVELVKRKSGRIFHARLFSVIQSRLYLAARRFLSKGMYSFFNKYLSGIYYTPGAVHNIRDISTNEDRVTVFIVLKFHWNDIFKSRFSEAHHIRYYQGFLHKTHAL